MDYTVHGILQARVLEWVAVPFSRGSSQPKPRSPTLQADSLKAELQGKPIETDSCIYVSKVCDYNLSKYEINKQRV